MKKHLLKISLGTLLCLVLPVCCYGQIPGVLTKQADDTQIVSPEKKAATGPATEQPTIHIFISQSMLQQGNRIPVGRIPQQPAVIFVPMPMQQPSMQFRQPMCHPQQMQMQTMGPPIYPNHNLMAADPYQATPFAPSVVAPSLVVYPNGVIVKPKVYLPGKWCHNLMQAITP